MRGVASAFRGVGVVLSAVVLAACGGGGGSSPPPAQPQTQAEVGRNAPQQNAFERPADWETDPAVWAQHPEFGSQPGLDAIIAQDAYAQGATGAGQVIGFVDTGLDVAYPEFAGKSIRLNDRSGLHEANHTQLSHGTGVASIALGARGHGSGFHGGL